MLQKVSLLARRLQSRMTLKPVHDVPGTEHGRPRVRCNNVRPARFRKSGCVTAGAGLPPGRKTHVRFQTNCPASSKAVVYKEGILPLQ